MSGSRLQRRTPGSPTGSGPGERKVQLKPKNDLVVGPKISKYILSREPFEIIIELTGWFTFVALMMEICFSSLVHPIIFSCPSSIHPVNQETPESHPVFPASPTG